MKVIVGITSKNRVSVLPKAIDSALEQNYLNKVIVVYDDGSVDGTDKLKYDYPNVSWILSEESKGLMYARNVLINFEEADLYCSLDDDAWFLSEDSISEAVEIFKSDSTIAAIAFNILSQDNSTPSPRVDSKQNETNMYIGCGHMLRINLVKEVGFYIQSPGFYGGEEKDLCIRLMDSGYKIVKVDLLSVWHDKTNVSRDINKQHRSGVCNDLVFTYRRTPFLILHLEIFYKIFSHLFFPIKSKKLSLYTPCLLGLVDFLRFLTGVATMRQAVSMSTYFKYHSFKL